MRRHEKVLAAAMIGMITSTGVVGLTSTSWAGCCASSPTSTTTGASARYVFPGDDPWNDAIWLEDTKSDGFSVYANYQISGGTVNSTSQCSTGYKTKCKKVIGGLADNNEVRVRAARDVEGAANNYGSWVRGYS